jgi:ATP-dependent DNA helicase RecQ
MSDDRKLRAEVRRQKTEDRCQRKNFSCWLLVILKLKIFTFQFSDGANGFDDKPLQDFITDKEVIDFSEHFFIHQKTPYLTILLSYRVLADDEKRKNKSRPDPAKELDEQERQAYGALRSWRAARARQEGIPPYMIANNKQLAKMIKLRATNRAALASVGGIGDAKTTKYGDEILQTIAQHLKIEAKVIEAQEKNKETEP